MITKTKTKTIVVASAWKRETEKLKGNEIFPIQNSHSGTLARAGRAVPCVIALVVLFACSPLYLAEGGGGSLSLPFYFLLFSPRVCLTQHFPSRRSYSLHPTVPSPHPLLPPTPNTTNHDGPPVPAAGQDGVPVLRRAGAVPTAHPPIPERRRHRLEIGTCRKGVGCVRVDVRVLCVCGYD